MVNSSPLVMITSIYKSLTNAEQKVADFVSSNTQDVVYSTVTDLSEKSGVGETTVLRFCRKLGYGGFQEFKLAIAQEMVSPGKNVHGKIEETDSIAVVSQKITAENRRAIEDTMKLVQQDSMEKSVEAIINARKTIFLGVGASGITAKDAQNRFMRIGINCSSISDSHIMAMEASLLSSEDVVFGISTSGSTKDTVDAVRLAKEAGAFIICLTNQGRSPITQYADAILLAAARETPLQGGSFSSKIVQLQVLDTISTIVAIRQREEAVVAVEKTAKAVIGKMY